MKRDSHGTTSIGSLNCGLTNGLENRKVLIWKHDLQRLVFIPWCCRIWWAVYNCGKTLCVILMFKTAALSPHAFRVSSDGPSSNLHKTHMGDFSASSNHNTTTVVHAHPETRQQRVVPPDLTDKITRSSNQYCDGGGFSDIYKCVYNGDDGANMEVCMLFHHLTDPAASLLHSRWP